MKEVIQDIEDEEGTHFKIRLRYTPPTDSGKLPPRLNTAADISMKRVSSERFYKLSFLVAASCIRSLSTSSRWNTGFVWLENMMSEPAFTCRSLDKSKKLRSKIPRSRTRVSLVFRSRRVVPFLSPRQEWAITEIPTLGIVGQNPCFR